MAQNNGPYSPPPNPEKPLPNQYAAAQQTPQATGTPYAPPNYSPPNNPPPNVEKPSQAHYNSYPGQQYRQQHNLQNQSYYGPPQDQYWAGQQYSYQYTQYHNQPPPQPQPQIVVVQAPRQEDDCLPCACLGILTAALFCPFFFCC